MKGPAKLVIAGVVLSAAAFGYRMVNTPANDDFRNYEVVFVKPQGWKELPHNPNTLLLMKHPETQMMLRCSATQVVSEINPEPDMDTENIVKRVVQNARENQPDWKTEPLDKFHNGKVEFKLFRKENLGKTIVAAMAVRGNTTLLVSVSNTGVGAQALSQGKIEPLLAFLRTIDLRVTDKWIKIHEKYE